MGVLPRIGRWASGPGAAVLTMAALLLLWEAAVVGLDIQRFLLPAPSDVVAEFIRDWRLIFFHAGQTVWGILAGWFIWSHVPDIHLLTGASIVAISGLYVIYKEIRLTNISLPEPH